jgi:hypothetical protein
VRKFALRGGTPFSGDLFRRYKPQRPRPARGSAGVVRVVHAVGDGHFREVERADAFQAGDIDAVLVRIGATLVVGVDAAARAEEVLGRSGVESIARQGLLAAEKLDAACLRRDDDRAAHAATGAIAAQGGVEAVAERRLEADRTAMALAGSDVGLVCHYDLRLMSGSCLRPPGGCEQEWPAWRRPDSFDLVMVAVIPGQGRSLEPGILQWLRSLLTISGFSGAQSRTRVQPWGAPPE